MSWGKPELLSLLWVLPALLVFLWLAHRSRARALRKLGPMLGFRSSRYRRRAHRWQSFCWFCGLSLALVALAQPRWGERWIEVEQPGLDLVVVMDVSSSMDAEDASPSRRVLAERKIIDLSRMSTGERIGMVIFARTAMARLPLTRDMLSLEQVATDRVLEQHLVRGSDIGRAIDMAAMLLDDGGEHQRAILLISDGEDHEGGALRAAEEAAEAGIRLYTLGVGTPEGAPLVDEEGRHRTWRGDVIISRLDEEVLRQIAQIGQGAYVRAGATSLDIDRLLLDEIRAPLEFSSGDNARIREWNEQYQWFLLAAMVFLLAGLLTRPGHLRLSGTSLALGLTSLILMRPDLASGQDDEPDWNERVVELGERQVENPDDLDLAEQLGEALYRDGDYNRAYRVLREVAEQSTDPAQQARARTNAGLAAYHAGRLEQAVSDWEQVLETDPEHPAASQNAEAVRREIELRRQEPPPPPPESEESEGEGEEEEESSREEGEGQSGESSGEGESEQESTSESPGEESDETDGSESADGDSSASEDSEADGMFSQTDEDTEDTEDEEASGGSLSEDDENDSEAEDEEALANEGNPNDDFPTEELSENEARRLLNSVREGSREGERPERSHGGRDW